MDYTDYKVVKKLLEDAQSADEDNRELAKEAHLFISKPNGQWEQGRWNDADGKPRYTFDQTSPIVDQISGDIEEADFDIQIKPANGDATKDLAELRDGLVRNIETISDAQSIYSNAGRNVVTAGIDHWMVKTEFVDDNSFDQDLVIVPLHDSIDRVWFDVGSQRQDREDSDWGFLLSSIPTDEAKEKFPKRSISSVGTNTQDNSYYNKVDSVVIGNFFYRKLIDRTLVKTRLGRVYEDDEKFQSIKDELAASGEDITDTRTRQDSVFYVRKFDGDGWLGEEEETVFSTIPIVPVYGNFKVIENKTVYHGVVQKLMDPQRVLNYSLSREIEEGALAPRAKYWMTAAQAKGHTGTLETLNTNADPVQLYNPDGEVPPPTQQGGAQINAGLRVISDGMQQIMGRTSGIFAAGMGDNPGLQSGVAIDKLQDKGNNITVKYFKSIEIAVCRTGRLLDDAFPKVYDVESLKRIINEDGSFDMKKINQSVTDEQTGKEVLLNDLSAGKYDVTCQAGKSYDSRQSEAVDSILALASIDPTVIQLGSDIITKNMNGPGLDKIAERQRKQLFEGGVIPDDQLTDEEKQELEEMKKQPQQPDAMMVAAQAEQAKADAEMQKAQIAMQKNQIEMTKVQNNIQNQQQQLMLASRKLELDAQQKEIEFAEKIAKLDQSENKQEFDQMMAMREMQRAMENDAVNNLKTQADTLNTLFQATGADAIISPTAAKAYDNQSKEIIEDQRET